MPTEIYLPGSFEPDFELDADLQWTDTTELQTTERKVEGKGIIADHVALKPDRASVEGLVTAMTVGVDLPEAEKLVNARSRLKQLAKKKQIVLVLSELEAAYLVINRAEVSKSVADGHSIRVRIGFIEIETTTVGTAQIPASKLRAKVKRKAATGKQGGAAKGSQPKGRDKTIFLGLWQGVGIPLP